jgi:hypothetical protein
VYGNDISPDGTKTAVQQVFSTFLAVIEYLDVSPSDDSCSAQTIFWLCIKMMLMVNISAVCTAQFRLHLQSIDK